MQTSILRGLFATAASVAAIAVATPASATVELINNGGFETGNFSGWTQSGNTGFTFVQCGPGQIAGNCTAYFGPVGSVGGISQTIATIVGRTYVFNFALRNLGGPTNSFAALIGGNTVLSYTNAGAFGAALNSFNYVATGTSTAVQFNFRQDPSYFGLDSVSLTAGVPEPMTWALMILGFGLIGGAMRRRVGATTTTVRYA